MEKKYYVYELWQQFVDKLISEWKEKYEKKHGPFTAINEVENTYNFASDVRKNIQKNFILRNIPTEVVNATTLNHAFQKNALTANTKTKSLDMYCQYIGYEDWDVFCQQNEERIKEKILNQESVIPVSTDPSDRLNEAMAGGVTHSKKPILSRKVRLIPAIILLFLLAFIFFKFKSRSQEVALITSLIQSANQAEFNIYMNVPEIDSTELDLYYTENSVSRASILGGAIKRARCRTRLRTKQSAFNILETEVINVKNNEAKVKTKEKWNLIWYSEVTNKDSIYYDHLNSQEYFLIKKNGRWKIQVNEYKGNAEMVQPGF